MLLANNLSFERNGRNIFSNLDISVSPNKIIHIKGRNGIGKTTLIKVLVNMIIPNTGDIYWNGKNIKKNINEYYNNLTYIMDTSTSKHEMTVIENIKFWMKLNASKLKTKEMDAILQLLLLNPYKNTQTSFLSAGEIKKLELCRLIIEQKKLWILDEPYVGLDASVIEIVNETFNNHINNNGMIIFSSHYNPELRNMDTLLVENYANN
tara:strand:+ start:1352 stop:1975 length:624 start_codon:yes stop_codon:yes gene_type:complete